LFQLSFSFVLALSIACACGQRGRNPKQHCLSIDVKQNYIICIHWLKVNFILWTKQTASVQSYFPKLSFLPITSDDNQVTSPKIASRGVANLAAVVGPQWPSWLTQSSRHDSNLGASPVCPRDFPGELYISLLRWMQLQIGRRSNALQFFCHNSVKYLQIYALRLLSHIKFHQIW